MADKENPMALDRAEAISKVAQTVINSAKVEVDFLKLSVDTIGVNKPKSSFIESKPALAAIEGTSKP